MYAVPYGTLGVNRDQWGPGVESSERERFDTVLEKVLAELEPVALQEQMFCINFFQMDVLSPTTKNTQTTLDVLEKSVDSAQSMLASPTTQDGICIFLNTYHHIYSICDLLGAWGQYHHI